MHVMLMKISPKSCVKKAQEPILKVLCIVLALVAGLAEVALDIGFYISFSGIVTFKKVTELQDIAKDVPEDRILVENRRAISDTGTT